VIFLLTEIVWIILVYSHGYVDKMRTKENQKECKARQASVE
jgi:hypothetical protein